MERLATLLHSTDNNALAPSPVIPLQTELGTSKAQRNVTEQLK